LNNHLQARETQNNFRGAFEDAQTLLEVGECSASEAARLEAKAKEKEQRDTEEALGKLKELGNSLLGNFGLSLDNFKMDKDPNSGSYNIRFEQ